MEITPDNLEWSSDNVIAWATFLNSPTGKRLIPKLAEAAPRLLAGGDINAILIRSGELRGHVAAVQALLDLSTVEQAQTPAPAYGEYPPLDLDEAWENTTKK